MKNKRIYNIWSCMKQRCNNPNHTAAFWNHDKGITVCEEWLHDFQAFYDWAMANGYRDDLTIDRKDSNKGYCPENCRWITFEENRVIALEKGRDTDGRRKNKKGRFMVVKMEGKCMSSFVEVIKIGLTKSDAVKLSNQLKEREPYRNNHFYDRVTGRHKEGDIVLWKELKQYRKSKSVNQ